MKFDRSAPGGGVEVRCRLENGKAFLEWEFYFQTDCGGAQAAGEMHTVRVCLLDGQGNVVLEGRKAVREEEPLEAVLLQPHLWRAVKDPYLYGMEAVLADGDGRCTDRIYGQIPLREARAAKAGGPQSNAGNMAHGACGSMGELLLNGEAFVPRAVCYSLSYAESGAGGQRAMLEDLRQMVLLGANCICVGEEGESGRLFLQCQELCDRFGLLALTREGKEPLGAWVCSWNRKVRVQCGEEIPRFRGAENSLFPIGSQCPTTMYYKYRAKWSETPFVYLAPESLEKLESGKYAVRCYSNCGRVALYADGSLFEFQRGDGEYVFREIPAKYPCIMLAAEGEGCSTSLSVQKALRNC